MVVLSNMLYLLHPKLCNINVHNITHSLISQNPRERTFKVQISLLVATFLPLISQNLSLMQTTKEINPHPCIAPYVNMWSATFLFVFFFFLCHLLNVGACIHHIAREGQSGVDHTSVGDERTNSNRPHISLELFHNVTCYANSIVSRIHVKTTKLRNIAYTLVAIGVILQSLECICLFNIKSLKKECYLHHLLISNCVYFYKFGAHFIFPPPRAAFAADFNTPRFEGLNLLGFKALRSLVAVHAVPNIWPAVDIVSSVTWPACCPNLQIFPKASKKKYLLCSAFDAIITFFLYQRTDQQTDKVN